MLKVMCRTEIYIHTHPVLHIIHTYCAPWTTWTALDRQGCGLTYTRNFVPEGQVLLLLFEAREDPPEKILLAHSLPFLSLQDPIESLICGTIDLLTPGPAEHAACLELPESIPNYLAERCTASCKRGHVHET